MRWPWVSRRKYEALEPVLGAAYHALRMYRGAATGTNPIFVSTLKSLPVWDRVQDRTLDNLETALRDMGYRFF